MFVLQFDYKRLGINVFFMSREYEKPDNPFLTSELSDCFVVTVQTGKGTRNQYIEKKPLSSGGYSTVHHAYDTLLHRPVAVKIIPLGRRELHNKGITQGEHKKAVQAEVKVQKSMDRYAVPIHTVYSIDDPELSNALYPSEGMASHEYICVTMHALNLTDNLHSIIDKGAYAFPFDEIISFGMQCADALDYFLKNGLVFREWKPKNLFWQNHCSLRVVDFGISSAVLKSTHVLDNSGTLAYANPEQVATSRWCDIRSEVYSIGCTLYECIVGKTPFELGLDPYFPVGGLDSNTQYALEEALSARGISPEIQNACVVFFNTCFGSFEHRFAAGHMIKCSLQKVQSMRDLARK